MSQDRITKLARGRECQVRLPGCLFTSETVVLGHFRLAGISGMSIKPPSLIGSWVCAHCHSIVDRDKSAEVQLAFAHGVFRAQAVLLREGKILA